VADPDWLPASGDAAEVAVDGRALRLTSLGRVLYPAAGFTKRDLIAYYAAVAGVLLPHIAGRPLTLGRWPTGVDARGFAQMECRGAPDWMKTRPLQLRTGEIRNYCVIDDLPSLMWAANQSTIELHPYYGSGPGENEARQAIFDLDPRPGASLPDAAAVALRLRELLGKRGHDPVVKASGGDGLHVFAPLATPENFAHVRAFCDEVAEELGASAVNVDCAQNHPRRSLAAPYSLRAADIPLVSAPLRWDEVERAVADQSLGGLVITAAQIPARIAELGDLFAPLLAEAAARSRAVM
jgi:bifunctional non-homologous end joining protein LigD